MIPASNIGKHNYNILGNKLVGETHASRMQRVNQLQPMEHSLKNPNMGAMAILKEIHVIFFSRDDISRLPA